MLIRMTNIGSHLLAGVVTAVLAVGGAVAGADSGSPSRPAGPTALVIDAALAREGRELVDPRLRDVDAEVRLPRAKAEALVNVRYLDALGYRLVVAGPDASAAADAAGVASVRAAGLEGALRAGRAPPSAAG